MGYTYAMSDIHGHYNEFMSMLDKINFNQEDRLYIIGDVVDRGPDAFKILEYIMGESNIELIRGNHEEWLISTILTYGYKGNPYESGSSYRSIRQMKKMTPRKRLNILSYLKSTPYFKQIKVGERDVLLVHAGINNLNPEDTPQDFMIEVRDEFLNDMTEYPFYIIHGHTPVHFMTESKEGKIHHYRNRSNIDCGCGYVSGRLGCLRIDDGEEYYME